MDPLVIVYMAGRGESNQRAWCENGVHSNHTTVSATTLDQPLNITVNVTPTKRWAIKTWLSVVDRPSRWRSQIIVPVDDSPIRRWYRQMVVFCSYQYQLGPPSAGITICFDQHLLGLLSIDNSPIWCWSQQMVVPVDISNSRCWSQQMVVPVHNHSWC